MRRKESEDSRQMKNREQSVVRLLKGKDRVKKNNDNANKSVRSPSRTTAGI